MTFLLSFPKDRYLIILGLKLKNETRVQVKTRTAKAYLPYVGGCRRESCVAYVGLTSSSFLIDSDAKSFWMVELEWRFQVYGWASVN